jgi:hypothetical protein
VIIALSGNAGLVKVAKTAWWLRAIRAMVSDGSFSHPRGASEYGSMIGNRPIDGDSRWNQSKKFSAKFPWEIKSVTF